MRFLALIPLLFLAGPAVGQSVTHHFVTGWHAGTYDESLPGNHPMEWEHTSTIPGYTGAAPLRAVQIRTHVRSRTYWMFESIWNPMGPSRTEARQRHLDAVVRFNGTVLSSWTTEMMDDGHGAGAPDGVIDFAGPSGFITQVIGESQPGPLLWITGPEKLGKFASPTVEVVTTGRTDFVLDSNSAMYLYHHKLRSNVQVSVTYVW